MVDVGATHETELRSGALATPTPGTVRVLVGSGVTAERTTQILGEFDWK